VTVRRGGRYLIPTFSRRHLVTMGNTPSYNLVLMASAHVSRQYQLPSNYMNYREHPAALLHNLDFHLTEPQLHFFIINGLTAYHRALEVANMTQLGNHLKQKVIVLVGLLLPNIDRVGSEEESYKTLLSRLTLKTVPERLVCLSSDPKNLFPHQTQILLQILDEALDQLNTECGRIKLEFPAHCELPCTEKVVLTTPPKLLPPTPTNSAASSEYLDATDDNTLPSTQTSSRRSSTSVVTSIVAPDDEPEDFSIGGEEELDMVSVCSSPSVDLKKQESNPTSTPTLTHNEILMESWRKALNAKCQHRLPETPDTKCLECNTSFTLREIANCRSCCKSFCNVCCPIREYLYPDGRKLHNRYCDNCEPMFLLGSGAEVHT